MAHCKHCKQELRLGGVKHRCSEGDDAANGDLHPVDQRRLVSRFFTVFFEFGSADGCCGYVTLRAKNKTAAKKQWLAEYPDDRITKVINGGIRFKFVYSANDKGLATQPAKEDSDSK